MFGRLTVVSGDFVLTGGMDRANYALADYASRAGIEVNLVSHRVSPELLQRSGVHWYRVPRPAGWHSVGEPLLDWRGRHVLRARGDGTSVAIVNGGNCLAPAVNWVHYVHSAYRERVRPEFRAVKHWAIARRSAWREKEALRRALLVMTNSNATRRAVIERLGIEPSRVHTVYYGIDPVAFAPITESERMEARRELGLSERLVLAFIGALGDRRKGFDTLIDAWELLTARSSWDADLVVVGRGRELGRYLERARSRKLEQRIRFLGFRKDVPRVLAACDGLVAPARYEAFGLGVAEAMARGLPAIVSGHAGVAELYPDELRGLLIDDVDSASELAERLERWRNQRAELTPSVEEVAARIRARTWDHMAEDVLSLCRTQ